MARNYRHWIAPLPAIHWLVGAKPSIVTRQSARQLLLGDHNISEESLLNAAEQAGALDIIQEKAGTMLFRNKAQGYPLHTA